MGIFQCHVSFQGCNNPFIREIPNIQTKGPKPPIFPLVEQNNHQIGFSDSPPPKKRHQKTAANEVKNQLCVMNKAQKQAEERNVAKGALLQVGPVSVLERFLFLCGKAWIFGAIFFFGGFIWVLM